MVMHDCGLRKFDFDCRLVWCVLRVGLGFTVGVILDLWFGLIFKLCG